MTIETGKLGTKTKKILQLVISIPHGILIKNISKSTAIPERTVYRHIEKLEKLELIKKVDGIVIANSLATSDRMAELLSKNKIELHKLSFILDLIKKPDWWDHRSRKLMKLKDYHFKTENHLKNNHYHQGTSELFLIQTFNNSIIFQAQKRYYGVDAYDCFIQGLNDLMQEISYLESRLKITLFYDNIPHLRIRSNHYNKIRDVLAQKCKREGKKFEVWIKGDRRAWIDMSEPLGLETNNLEDMHSLEIHIADILEKCPPKISEIANILVLVLENQKEITNNLVSLSNENKETAIGLKLLTKCLIKNEKVSEESKLERPNYIQ